MRTNILLLVFFLISLESYSQNPKENIYFPEEKAGESSTIERRKHLPMLLERANVLYNAEAYDEAAKLFGDIIRRDPYHVMAYFGRANSREYLGDIKGALADYRIVQHLNPEMNEAFFNCAVLEFNSGGFPAAVKLFEKLLTMPVGATQAIYFKGVQHSPNTAPILTGVSSLSGGKDELIHHFLGKCYDALNDYKASEKHYTKAIAISRSREIYLDRGIMRHKFDDQTGAIEDFKQTLSLDPNNSLALFWLSVVAQEMGEDSLTIAALDQIIEGENVFPEVYIHRGVLKYKSGDYEDAIRDFDNAIALSSGILDAYLHRGLARSKLDDYTGAIKDFDRALIIDEQNLQAYEFRGNTHYKVGNFNAAVEDYNASIKLDQQNAKVYYNRALALNNLPEHRESTAICEDLQKAIALGMKNATKALNGLCP